MSVKVPVSKPELKILSHKIACAALLLQNCLGLAMDASTGLIELYRGSDPIVE
jgi:hypothetical protein